MKRKFEKLDKSEYLKFYKSLYDARLVNKHGCFVSLDRPEIYQSHDNYLLDDGVAGFSIVNGDLVGVHKNSILAEQQGYTHLAEEIMMLALSQGATTLDCYGDFLANMYMQYGFYPTGKMKFAREYNPDWDVEKFGEPDVIALCRVVKSSDELISLRENNGLLTYSTIKDNLPLFNDYIEMLEDRNLLLNQVIAQNLSYIDAINFIQSKNKDKEKV